MSTTLAFSAFSNFGLVWFLPRRKPKFGFYQRGNQSSVSKVGRNQTKLTGKKDTFTLPAVWLLCLLTQYAGRQQPKEFCEKNRSCPKIFQSSPQPLACLYRKARGRRKSEENSSKNVRISRDPPELLSLSCISKTA